MATGGGTSRRAREVSSATASAVSKLSRWVAWKKRWMAAVRSQAEQTARTSVGCSVHAAQPKRTAKPR